jgi:hypothetical protein
MNPTICSTPSPLFRLVDRSVTGIRPGQHDGRSVLIQENLAGRRKILARHHASTAIAIMPPNAATAPIARTATLALEPLVRQFGRSVASGSA